MEEDEACTNSSNNTSNNEIMDESNNIEIVLMAAAENSDFWSSRVARILAPWFIPEGWCSGVYRRPQEED